MADSNIDELYRAAWDAHHGGRHDESIALLERAISITTDATVKSAYLATKGGFLCRNSEYSLAIATLNDAILLNTKNIHALTQKGIAHLRIGDNEAASDCLELASELRPSASTFTLLAKSQLAFDPLAAKNSARKALELEPSWAEAKAILDAATSRILRE